jgi:YbgC/YbaW family acyl-CoA thioester hydrolase
MMFQQPGIFPITVQFEDIDAHGVVHHPNYFKYMERARLHGMKECGCSLEKLFSSGCSLAVSEIRASYLRPAFLEQELLVFSHLLQVGKVSIKINQSIILMSSIDEVISGVTQDDLPLPSAIFWSEIQLVYIDLKSGKPQSFPPDFKQMIKNFNANNAAVRSEHLMALT